MELTVAQKLEALLNLQSIDSELDEIKKLRGDLPDEVRDLEDEVVGFETRISKFKKEVDSLDAEINGYRLNKKDAEKLIQKYKDQQMNVRNNREYDAISKELELQELEIQLADKRIKEADFKIRNKNTEIADVESAMNARKKDLEAKRKELDVLVAESQEEEKALVTNRDKAATNVEERLINAYNRIRNNAGNGLAVVMVRRGACGGCFNIVPPQRQADIKDKKKIIVCEHCGRILADVDAIEISRK
ncbi:zinc ribbon domain-containing protein [Emticicia sp. BO119]|uniref:zinc ribbon domain-containing protein n=1 Tax=Emticicia sp. BO119 TaxID=2757768 RepID=UPI0015F08AF4|nr:C4-type zinc ribbon domain-containing protein [Emticicia sp. BO119]MBA4849192.1 hypothetical protein [Emticicia sp. BO119]